MSETQRAKSKEGRGESEEQRDGNRNPEIRLGLFALGSCLFASSCVTLPYTVEQDGERVAYFLVHDGVVG
jgi:hypothetical protein